MLAAADKNAAQPPVIRFDDVRFCWPRATNFALHIRNFEIMRGETTLLIGPSGSGKSTFLSLLCGIVTPQQGQLTVLGQNTAKFSASARDRFRSEHFGIIFQMFNLLPYGSVIDNVTLPIHFAPERKKHAMQSGSVEEEARRLLDRLGIETDSKAGSSAADLSVGQQQRVAAARALIGRPEIIVADEPTSSLDRNRQDDFLALLFEEVIASGATLLMVSHDETLGNRFDRVVRLSDIAANLAEANS